MSTSKYVEKTVLDENGIVRLSVRQAFVPAGQEPKTFIIASNNPDKQHFIEQAIETLEREIIAASHMSTVNVFNVKTVAKPAEVIETAPPGSTTTPAVTPAMARGFDW